MILDFLFPKTCVGCGFWGTYLCENCLNTLPVQNDQICPMCGLRNLNGFTHARCRRPWGMEGLTSIFRYHGVVRKLVSSLKYRFMADTLKTLINLLVSYEPFQILGSEEWLVIAVPLYRQRELWRGFNQAELIGKALSDYTGWSYKAKLLERTRATQPQISLEKKKRLENVKKAFRVKNVTDGSDEVVLRNKPVLLIDDVWTTGATIRTCAKELKRVGAKKVWGLTLAA